MRKISKSYKILFVFLVLLALLVVLFFVTLEKEKDFTFAVLDVGQGDALYIKSPSGTEVLVDGGPRGRMMETLPSLMSPFDRNIDAIILTNPDADHIAGFSDVLDRYNVGVVFESGTQNDSVTYQNLIKKIDDKEVPRYLAKAGMVLDLGGGAYIEVLFPDRDVRDWERNDGSVVARLVYGETSIMLTGDATYKTEDILLQNIKPEYLDSDILKVGHHGSYTSTSREFVKAVSPVYSVISCGQSNNYGHPHLETLSTLHSLGVDILRTDELGNIIFKCDRMGECKIKK